MNGTIAISWRTPAPTSLVYPSLSLPGNAGGQGGGPFAEVFVVGQPGVGLVEQAGRETRTELAAANRDPTVFAAPKELRPDRAGPAPLAFGHGSHYCLGAAVARLEIHVALEKVLARRPRLCADPEWRDTPAIRGPVALRAVFS